MSQNYLQIRNDNLRKAWGRTPAALAACLPAELSGDSLHFRAFGEDCLLTATEVTLAGEAAEGAEGLLISMYAMTVVEAPVDLERLKSFKELPGSMPYQGAFAINAEGILVPYVERLHRRQEEIAARFSGRVNARPPSGDFSFTLYPLPRVSLYYIFHLPDEDFPAAATCLFAGNALDFLPLAGLADTAEYTAKRMIEMVGGK